MRRLRHRISLLLRPRLLCERLGDYSRARRRLARLRDTVAADLELGHIDSMELLDAVRPLGIRVVYDVGANIGTWSLLARAVLGNVEIHAFEPLPEHFERLQSIGRSHHDIHSHQVCLAERNGEGTLHVTNYTDASSLLKLSERGKREWNIDEERREKVRLCRLDDYVFAHDVPLPDLIKADVQGAEVVVFSGATSCLASVKAVVVEVSFQEFYGGQCEFADVVAMMARYDLGLCAFGHGLRAGSRLVQADALFIRRPLMNALQGETLSSAKQQSNLGG